MKKLIKHPTYLVFLTALPLIFVTNTLNNAVITLISFIIIVLATYGISMLVDRFLNEEIKVYAYIIMVLGLATIARFILELTTNSDLNTIGIYLSIVLVALLFTIKQEQTTKLNLSFVDWLIQIGYVVILIIVVGLLREVLATGSLLIAGQTINIFNATYGIAIMANPAGGFIITGILAAIIQAIVAATNKEETI